MPELFIVAGPNGAGKTTYVRRFMPEEMRCDEFVNADLIAAGLSPFRPAGVAFQAGRIMVRRIRHLFVERASFSIETTLSGTGYLALLRDMRAAGYRIRLDFLWISDPEIARRRIRCRVAKGGHDIPDAVLRRRLEKGIRLLIGRYRPLLHGWRLYDNSGELPQLVAEERVRRFTVVDPPRLALIERLTSVSFMPKLPPTRVEEPVAMTFDEETRRSLRAIRKAYADAILENLAWGLPVPQWRPGRGVVDVPAEQLAPLARRILETNGEPLPPDEERRLLDQVRV